MAVDRSVGDHPVIIVQMIQQLFAREDFTRLLGEGFQQAELGGGEVQQLIAPGGLEAPLVNNQRAFRIQRLQIALRFAAAKNGLDPGHHLAWAVGLTDIIIGADL